MFYTPVRQAFERNHNLIPLIDKDEYSLLLLPNGKASEDNEPEEGHKLLTFDQIKQMPNHTVDVCFACAGSKRSYLQAVHPTIKGMPWTTGAVSN
jgi:hypothetical protein